MQSENVNNSEHSSIEYKELSELFDFDRKSEIIEPISLNSIELI